MPPGTGGTKTKSSKKKGRLARYIRASRKVPGDFLENAIDVGTGFPSAVYATGKALGKSALPGKSGDKELFNLVKAAGLQTKEDIRHPLRNPFNSFLLGLSVASGGAGTVSRVSAGARAAKAGESFTSAALRPPRYSRKMEIPPKVKQLGAPKTKVVKTRRGPKTVTTRTDVPKSLRSSAKIDVDLTPGGRVLRPLLLDPLYKASLKRAKAGKRGGRYAETQASREIANRERYISQATRGKPKAVLDDEAKPVSGLGEVMRAPANLLRLGMFARPRYYVQNIGGTAAMQAAQMPLAYGRMAALARVIKKENPELWDQLQKMSGVTGMESIALTSQGGPLSRAVRRVADVANKPEGAMRPLSLMREAELEGFGGEMGLQKLVQNPYANKAQLVMRRGNEAVADYGRLKPWEMDFMRTQIPIFYPMTKAFTRYTARLPVQHPALTAALAQYGEQGKGLQLESLDNMEPPWWAPYVYQTGDRLLNPQGIYPFAPGLDAIRQARGITQRGGPVPGLNLAQQLGPLPDLIAAITQGRDISTGFPLPESLRYKAGGTLRGGLEANTPSLLPLGDYLLPLLGKSETLGNLPGIGGFLQPRPAKTFEEPNLMDILGNAALSQGLYPRRLKNKGAELRRQQRQERSAERRRKLKAKKYGG